MGLGRLDEASRYLAGIDTKVVAQLAGFPDWFANAELARAEISYRQVISKSDAEPYQKRALETLTVALDKPASQLKASRKD
jgi:hypothetical protein